jgi:hypothetical protein
MNVISETAAWPPIRRISGGMAAALLFAVTLRAETITVSVHNTAVVKFARATAAYALDSAIADAVARGGEVSVSGKSVGATQVVVVSGDNQMVLDVQVTAPAFAAHQQKSGKAQGRIEARYGTAERQTHGIIDVGRAEGTRRTELHVESVHYGTSAAYRATTTLPSVSYRIFTPGRELTFFDRLTDESPLTISNTTVRGIHLVGDRWRVHAGTTAFASYQSFLVPAQHRNLLDVAYAMPLSPSSRITPGALITSKGSVASLMYDYHPDEQLFARGELAVSRGVAAAAQLSLDRDRDRLRVDLRYRPRDFVSVSPGEPLGFFADSSWSKTFGRGSTFDTSLSATNFNLPRVKERTVTSSTNVRLRLTDSFSLLGGANYGSFSGTRSINIPAGFQFDRERFGMSAVARWTESSTSNRGGPGFRITTRANLGRIYASGYVDYQRQAPTLSLIYREEPELALALEQLGITATSPSDIARALRDNSALIELGYIDGVTIDLTPARTQAGLELAWLGSGPSRMQLRARVLANRYETVSRHSDTLIAALTASRRLTDSADVFATYTYWESNHIRRPQGEVGVRLRFDDVPSFSRGTISGRVTSSTPVEIELDGVQRIRPAANGSFSFSGVSGGSHQVVARILNAGDAYFTTPSHIEANAGDAIAFNVASSPAHLFGFIASDAGQGIAGVVLAMTRGAMRVEATSVSDGSIAINAAPGEWELAIDTLSLPAGYSIGDASRSVMLEAAQPSNVAFTIRANRSIHGQAPAGVTMIEVEPLGLHVPVASDGAFTIRSLPAGAITLRAGARTKQVTMPREPATVNVKF